MKRSSEDSLDDLDDKSKLKKLSVDDDVQKFVATLKSEIDSKNASNGELKNDTNDVKAEEVVVKEEQPLDLPTETIENNSGCNSKDPEVKTSSDVAETIETSSKEVKTEELSISSDSNTPQTSSAPLILSTSDQSINSESNGRFKSNSTRDEAEYPQNPPKRQRRNEVHEEIRLLIPSSIAGAVIGKRGINIQKLRTNYNVKVNIVDCRGPERVLTILADMETSCDVIREIMKHFENQHPNEYDLRLLVHQSLAGCVIGKSGTKIKELKERIGCKLKVFPEHAPQSSDRVIQILGNEFQCIQALLEIYNLTRGSRIRGQIHNYDPNNFNEFHAENYGGFGIPVKNIQRNGRDQNRYNDRRVNNQRMNYQQPPRHYDYVSPWAAGNGNHVGYSPYNNGGMQQTMSQNGSASYAGNYKEERTSTQVTIPRDLAGALIGKRGERIRRIRSESNALIQIDESQFGANERIITITGTQSQIQSAQYLLQQCVREGDHSKAPMNSQGY